jgi:hypothetical protein
VTGIAIGSLIIAVFALGWTVYRDIATRADLRRESEERKDQLAREEGRREEELRLLRLQVERQIESIRADDRAELVGKSTGYSGDSSGVTFPMSVRNIGPAVARDVRVWLAIAPVGDDPVSGATITTPHDLGPLVPNEPPAKFNLHQAGASVGGGVPRDGLIIASWTDESGDRMEPIGKLTVFL